jgi:protein-L-isoaspartate O-methyltransferase
MESPYAREAPSAQQTVDLFAGKWASRLPPPLEGVRTGENLLFQDPKLPWAAEKLAELGVPVAGASVLELGPLEGGHTYLLSRMGAASVTAVEAHPEAYLKCLVAKELLGIERVNFLFGDAAAFLRQIGHSYDIAVAAGILYHMAEPVELIELLCRRARAVFLWTVHWDEEFSRLNPGKLAGSGPISTRVHRGFSYTAHRHNYGVGWDYGTFWGGPADHANWMERNEILGAFAHFGFHRQISVGEANANGAALAMVAVRD